MLFEKKIYLLSVLISSLFITLTQQAGFINISIYFLICYLGMGYIHCNYYGNCIFNIYLFLFLYIFFNILYIVFFYIFDIIIPKDNKLLFQQTIFKKNKKYIYGLDKYIKI